ncbi:tRNA (cytidine/uridine-2'-O-)-methyltransferase [Azospirillum fermentarium]|uniref:tRNA (cytidine(34)-2'-O)-methyltransferase n=1 Tax=Azospirillum fermentarium TaxID=1233114 RepID=UPI0022264D1B|nr:tRNA (cytidine(34)-2'-O)-methyltransferase [Azospirillum fermentarium]MCW2246390.1 tRNA (cytidine/uridine-2'-O-)-methyltransferase [Azospirillum fermentarium]
MRLVLFEPDIPQNAGTLMRLASCFGLPVDIIEPCGFILNDSKMRRAGMDYLSHVHMTRHTSWESYRSQPSTGRLVLLSTRAAVPYTRFIFDSGDRIMVGRESAGVPDAVHDSADVRLLIPMAPPARSLNVAVAAAMVLGEALRQTGGFPAVEG